MDDDTSIDRKVLRERADQDGTRHLEVRRLRDGRVVIEGQDLGAGVERAFGPGISEYEWSWTIARRHVPAAVRELGGKGDDDLLSLLAARYVSTDGMDPGVALDDAGVPIEFWSRLGD
jgi:hypothetical protein